MAENKKEKSDFRYDSGEAKVPWSTIGENTSVEDITEVIKFLIPPGEDIQVYNRQLAIINQEIGKLNKV